MLQFLTNRKKKLKIPKDWFAYEVGQSPLHMLWYAHLVYFPEFMEENNSNPKRVWVEEVSSLDEALEIAINKINKKEFVSAR